MASPPVGTRSGLGSGSQPVSYTHLDVYKRQGLDRAETQKVPRHILHPRCYYGHRHLPFQECRLGGDQNGSGQFRLSLREWHPVQRHDFKSLSILLQVYFDRESRSLCS